MLSYREFWSFLWLSPRCCIWGFLPLLEKTKNTPFGLLKRKLVKGSSSGKGNFFSQGGKDVLIKAVALAIPNYTMSVFRLPASLCHDLQSLIARFWWGGDDSKRKTSLEILESSLPLKGRRGVWAFGIWRPLIKAMLAKQCCWRILQNQEVLLSV